MQSKVFEFHITEVIVAVFGSFENPAQCFKKNVTEMSSCLNIIEDFTQIKLRIPQGGHLNGLNVKEKSGNKRIQVPLSKGIGKR
jgi:hypothetical protein